MPQLIPAACLSVHSTVMIADSEEWDISETKYRGEEKLQDVSLN